MFIRILRFDMNCINFLPPVVTDLSELIVWISNIAESSFKVAFYDTIDNIVDRKFVKSKAKVTCC